MKLKSLTMNGKTYDDFPSSDGGGLVRRHYWQLFKPTYLKQNNC